VEHGREVCLDSEAGVQFTHWRTHGWRIEQDYRELKDELGLDPFEGRSWPGWLHHVTLASMAYAFLVLETLRGKKTAGLTLPAVRRALQALLIRLGTWCPTCRRPWHDSS